MSITLTISKSGLKLSRHLANEVREESNANELHTKPDIASLDDFASKIRLFRRRENKIQNDTEARTRDQANRIQGQSVTPGEYLHQRQNVKTNKPAPLKGPSSGLPNVTEPLQAIGMRSLERTICSAKPTERNGSTSVPTNNPSSTILPGPATPATSSSTSGLEIGQTTSDKTDSTQADSGVDVGERSGALESIDEDQVHPIPTIQEPSSQPPKLPSGSSAVSSKGKEPLRYAGWKPTKVHIPRSKLERLKQLRIASSSTVKIEDVEFSVANKEKLRSFSRILASKKDQIELFGKELPLCRVCLVQVRENGGIPTPYICVQGLNNAADITRIHSAMSHKRYKPLYDPLRLCYETSDISHVGYPDIEGFQASQKITNEPGEVLYDATETFYQYKPVKGDMTYCGSLSRTIVNEQICISTFGGLVEVDGITYLMTCQHGVSEPSSVTAPSLSDTLVETDVPLGSEGPLVFCSGDLPSGIDGPGLIDAPRDVGSPTSPVSESSPDWKDLSINGTIRKGREWSLIPIEDYSILPNLIEKSSTKKGKGVGDLDIHYLDEISDPHPGSTSYIATGSTAGSSGVVSTGTSFIAGGGTDGVLEVWSILLDDDERLRKGDSGSWAIDTSDPLQYKVLGSVIATSRGAAHFIHLKDQFYEMPITTTKSPQASLAPVFRTLVQCAHIAFNRNDLSAEWLINEALSPRTLRQMRGFWCLPAIKTLIGVPSIESEGASNAQRLQGAGVDALKNLLLQYGVDLLDNIPHERQWLAKHWPELNGLELEVFSRLVAAAKPYIANTKNVNRQGNYTIEGNATVTLDPPARDNRDGGHTTRDPILANRENSFGFMLTKKSNRFSAVLLLTAIPMVAFAGLVGIAAMMVLLAAERGNVRGLFHIDIGRAASLGVVAGTISASPMVLQIVLIYLFSKYDWHLFIHEVLFTSSKSNHRVYSPIVLKTAVRFGLSTVVILLSSFARTSLAALYLAKVLGIHDKRPLFVASAAAAAPMLLSTASPTLTWYIIKQPGDNKSSVSLTSGLWMVSTGFDALAGYTFGRVTQNQGLDFFQPSSGAASFGVFGALTILWPILSWIPFAPCIVPVFLWRRTRVRKSQPEMTEPPSPTGAHHRSTQQWLQNLNRVALELDATALQPSRKPSSVMSSTLGPKSYAPSTWGGLTQSYSQPLRYNPAYMIGAGRTVPEGSGYPTEPSEKYRRSRLDHRVQQGPSLYPIMTPVELPTELPEHKPPEPAKPKPVVLQPPTVPFFSEAAEYLSDEPNYYVGSRQGKNYPSDNVDEWWL